MIKVEDEYRDFSENEVKITVKATKVEDKKAGVDLLKKSKLTKGANLNDIAS